MSTLAFDTHAFVKAFVNAKNDEERAEILAKTISETRQDSTSIVEKTNTVIDQKFDKAKNQLATKNDLKETELLLKKDIESLKVEMLKWMFGMLAGQLTLIIIILKFFFRGVGGI
jgi:hypothetical protein